MKQDKLINALISFVSLDDAQLAERSKINFHIYIQPNSISYGGDFDDGKGKCKPVDLKKIGKQNCNLFSKFLEEFHQESTDNGRNKWNRALISKALNGTFEARFLWDEEWEKNEIAAYINSESERGKWYWEEK